MLSGNPISRALGAQEHIFGRTYVASVAAAESAGRLPEVLDRLAGLLRSELRMRSTLRTLLAYPVLLVSISLLVVTALVLFVLPQFAEVFDQLELKLPITTELLIGLSGSMRSRWWLWGAALASAVAGLVWFLRSRSGRWLFHTWLVSAPILRDVSRPLLAGRIFRLLGTMVESGVPLVEGIRLTRAAVDNQRLRELLDTLEHEVINGRGLSNTFCNSPLLPPGVAQMIAAAERTGALGPVAQLMGSHYEEEGETRLREVASVLEPLIIIGMGLLVASLLTGFTGYSLVFEQLSYWGATVGANLSDAVPWIGGTLKWMFLGGESTIWQNTHSHAPANASRAPRGPAGARKAAAGSACCLRLRPAPWSSRPASPGPLRRPRPPKYAVVRSAKRSSRVASARYPSSKTSRPRSAGSTPAWRTSRS